MCLASQHCDFNSADWISDNLLLSFSSADVRGAGTRDEPLRTSAWEATSTAAISTVCRNVKRAFQYVTHYRSANQEFADASVRRYEQKGVLRAGVPSPSRQSPSPISLPPYPLSPTPFDACYAGYLFIFAFLCIA